MLRFTLPSGRKVELKSLHILATRSGRMVADEREHQTDVLSALVRQLYPGVSVPYAVVWPAGESIPQTTCIASFTSRPLDLPEVEGYSYLVACWFVHQVEASIPAIVMEGLSRLDWESNARDYSGW